MSAGHKAGIRNSGGLSYFDRDVGLTRNARARGLPFKVSDSVLKYWETIADNLSKAGWSWGWRCALLRPECNA